MTIGLRPFDFVRDMAILRQWLLQPGARRWWGPPARVLRELAEAPPVGAAMILAGTQPVGFVAWQHPLRSDLAAAGLVGLPEGAVDIDILIGLAPWRGRGVGSRALRVLRNRLLAEGAPLLIYCAEGRNRRSLGAAVRAGFRRRCDFRDPIGGAMRLMVARGRPC